MMSLSCRTWFELTEVVCTVSSLPVGSGNSGSQLQLMDLKKTDSTVLQLVSSHIADRGCLCSQDSGSSGSQLQLMDHTKQAVLQLVSSHRASRGVSVQSSSTRVSCRWLEYYLTAQTPLC